MLGRRGQGSTTFLDMMAGRITLVTGYISLGGKIAYLSEDNFTLVDTLYKNLAFYDNTITRE